LTLKPPATPVLTSSCGTQLSAHSPALRKFVAPMSSRNWLVITEIAAEVSLSGVSVRPPARALAAV
jgi:hypothetical protein